MRKNLKRNSLKREESNLNYHQKERKEFAKSAIIAFYYLLSSLCINLVSKEFAKIFDCVARETACSTANHSEEEHADKDLLDKFTKRNLSMISYHEMLATRFSDDIVFRMKKSWPFFFAILSEKYKLSAFC